MEERTVPLQLASDESIAGYGRYIHAGQQEPLATFAEFSYWADMAFFDHTATSIGLGELREQPRMISSTFEQHLETTETLIPADGDVVLVLARSKAEDIREIDLETMRAVRVNAGDAVVLDRGIWHFAPHPVKGTVKVWVLFEAGTSRRDVFIRHLEEEQNLRFVVEKQEGQV